MAKIDPENIDGRHSSFPKVRLHYWAANTQIEQSLLLDEVKAVIKLYRKSVIRLLNGELAHNPRRQQRERLMGKMWNKERKGLTGEKASEVRFGFESANPDAAHRMVRAGSKALRSGPGALL